MVDTAMRMFQRHGYRATSWRSLTKAGGTPWGSVQHHFPGGKEEIGVAAIALASDAVDHLIRDCLANAAAPAAGIARWFTVSGELLAADHFEGGCPVAPVVLEMASDSPALRAACAEALATWTATVSDALQADGLVRRRADAVAATVVAAFEGAMILARAQRDTAPIDQAAEIMADLVAAR